MILDAMDGGRLANHFALVAAIEQPQKIASYTDLGEESLVGIEIANLADNICRYNASLGRRPKS